MAEDPSNLLSTGHAVRSQLWDDGDVAPTLYILSISSPARSTDGSCSDRWTHFFGSQPMARSECSRFLSHRHDGDSANASGSGSLLSRRATSPSNGNEFCHVRTEQRSDVDDSHADNELWVVCKFHVKLGHATCLDRGNVGTRVDGGLHGSTWNHGPCGRLVQS
jgi:hypothetical protein